MNRRENLSAIGRNEMQNEQSDQWHKGRAKPSVIFNLLDLTNSSLNVFADEDDFELQIHVEFNVSNLTGTAL